MKSIVFIILLASASLYSQTESKSNSDKVVESVPISVINEVPVFPGCEYALGKKGRKACLNRKMNEHVMEAFNRDIFDCIEKEQVLNEETNEYENRCIEMRPGRVIIYLMFKIGVSGLAENITARASHPVIVKETIRIAKLLPKMEPGRQKGKVVRTGYTLPIVFNVQ
ncbi:energy transducer TonB [Tenacibaculum xiamenense]|uniref:energy transducer TonB n=1 Tax=Tenacibaculum xiamenense TaxID=1261553 RepID=UPI0038B54CC7